ncbi:MAG: hypothetical protein OQJ78_08495 [Ignavibacteriaceae bacterium]|nr:hypothetical protein [Ignavibacteriaceae bacterium]
MVYTFKYRRILKHKHFFFVALKSCIGHQLDTKTDVMTVHFAHGGLQSIINWKECELKLGKDFGIFIRAQAEKEAGQPLKVKV